MAYVICQPCIGEKNAACTLVCPTDAIHPLPSETGHATEEQLYIDPTRCIDCSYCASACPVSAIFPAGDVPSAWQSFIQKNADYFGV